MQKYVLSIPNLHLVMLFSLGYKQFKNSFEQNSLKREEDHL